MRKRIVWVTPVSFIDCNLELVPFLSHTYDIYWIITASATPSIYDKIKRMENNSLRIELYLNKTKWYMPMKFFSSKRFYRYLCGIKSNLIYINEAPQLWSYYAACLFLPIEKTVFALHNVKTPKGARHEHFARYYMNKVIKRFQLFQVFSNNQNNYLKSRTSGKNILYAQLTLENFGPPVVRSHFMDITNFLSFGYIRDYKRLDLLIVAAQKLYEETNKPFIVTIAGVCNDWGKYAKMIKYPQLFNLHIGFIDYEDVPSFFSNCDYAVFPYQDIAQSGALMQAFYYHVPSITSDIPSFREFINNGENGFLFKAEDVISLKDIMKRVLYFSKDEKDKLIISTKAYVERNHSIDSLADKYISFFDKYCM